MQEGMTKKKGEKDASHTARIRPSSVARTSSHGHTWLQGRSANGIFTFLCVYVGGGAYVL